MAAFREWIVPRLETNAAIYMMSVPFFAIVIFVILRMNFPIRSDRPTISHDRNSYDRGMKRRNLILLLLIPQTVGAAIGFAIANYVGETVAWIAFETLVGAYAMWFVVRWFNLRDDPRNANRPPDPL